MAHPNHNDRLTLIIIFDVNFQLFMAVSLKMKAYFWLAQVILRNVSVCILRVAEFGSGGWCSDSEEENLLVTVYTKV
jgi:hypothetical protein